MLTWTPRWYCGHGSLRPSHAASFSVIPSVHAQPCDAKPGISSCQLPLLTSASLQVLGLLRLKSTLLWPSALASLPQQGSLPLAITPSSARVTSLKQGWGSHCPVSTRELTRGRACRALVIARLWLRPYLGESAELGNRGLSCPREKSVTLPVKDTETEWNVIQAGLLRSHQLCRDFYRNSFISCCQGHRRLRARSGWGHTSTRTIVGPRSQSCIDPTWRAWEMSQGRSLLSSGPHPTALHLCDPRSPSPVPGPRDKGPPLIQEANLC